MHNDAATRLHQPTQDGDYASEAEVEPTKATQPATASRLVGASSSKEPVVDDSKETTAGGPVTEAVATAPSRIRATPVSLSWANVFPRPASHPENSLEWTVPDDIFKKAQQAPAGTKESFYSHKLYRGQGRLGKDTPVTVHYCRTAQAAEKVCQQHFADESVIGFDLEWEAGATAWEGARPNVSLIQVRYDHEKAALAENACVILQINRNSATFHLTHSLADRNAVSDRALSCSVVPSEYCTACASNAQEDHRERGGCQMWRLDIG